MLPAMASQNLCLGQHQHHCLMMMNRRQTTTAKRVTQRIVIEDDTGFEDENAQHTDKGKMYLELLAQSSKKRKKSMSTYSEDRCSPSHSHVDSSRYPAVNHQRVDERGKSLKTKLKMILWYQHRLLEIKDGKKILGNNLQMHLSVARK